MAKAAELDKDLVDGLKAAKSKRAYFALVLKGASDGALILSKTKVPPASIAAAKKQSGGSAVIKGFCQYEDGKYIFETAKEAPATAAQAVKVIVKRDAGMAVHAEFRVNADPELLADEGGSTTATPPQAPPAPPDGDLVAQRLHAMTADIKAALAGPNKARVQALFVAINDAIKNKDFVQAGKGLDELEPLVKQGTPPGTPPQDGADVVKRLNAMTADIKAALAGPNKARVQELFVAVGGHIKNKDFVQASKGLDELQSLLSKTGTAATGPAAGGKLSLVALAKSRLSWRTERINAIAEIGRLEAALSQRFKGVESQKNALSAAVVRLDKLIKTFGPQLDDGLDYVLNGDEAARPGLIKQARALMDGFQKTIDGDEVMAALDGNEVLPDMAVTEPLRLALGKISAALGPITA
ncbi:MAG TPA: hypothetical protein VGY55_06825 [Pirellulales bacterium]|jgi:hypothetical protein|nr:hypothetical protein [Pirellulales bacterium]